MPAYSPVRLSRQQSSGQGASAGPPGSAANRTSSSATSTPAASAYAEMTVNPVYSNTTSMPLSSLSAIDRPSATSTMAAGGPPAASHTAGPRQGQGRPEPKKECLQKADSTSICKWTDYSRQNSTDVMNQGGVFDYHNQHSQSDDEAIAGKIPGTDIAGTVASIPTGPPAAGATGVTAAIPLNGATPPTSQNSRGTVFQGSKADSSAGSQDTHDGPNDFSNHMDGSSHDAIDWQAQSQYQGSNSKADIGISSDSKNEGLVTNANGAKDTTTTSESKTAGGTDISNQSAQQGNSTADIDFKNESSAQKEEHTGNRVYEFHEETSAKGSMSQNFNGGNAIADAGKAYGEMVGTLGGGARKEKREIDAVSSDEQNISIVKVDGEMPKQVDQMDSVSRGSGLQDVLQPLSNGTSGIDNMPSLGLNGAHPMCILLVFGALACGGFVVFLIMRTTRAENRKRRGEVADAGYEMTQKAGKYSDSA